MNLDVPASQPDNSLRTATTAAHKSWRDVVAARQAAHRKHGENSIEGLPANSPAWLAVLVEEVGEVAQALTYDGAPAVDLRSELIDVLAVAYAWLAAIDDEPLT